VSQSSSPRQLAAILFTDVVGYTGMMQTDEHQAITLMKHYNAVLEKWVTHFEGRIVNYYGDGSLCIFSSATLAVQCAIEIQKDLRNEPVVPLRIGLHIGEVIFEDGKALGDGVNIASRIQSLGQGNTILISAEIHDKIKNNLTITSKSLGHFDFKNVNKPMEVFALANDGLYVPSRKTLSGKLEAKSKVNRNVLIGVLILLAIFGGLRVKKIFFPLSGTQTLDKSIAVLPFTDMSAHQDQEFFSDGLTEDIITQLAKIKAFKVTSRTSVMPYKNNTKSIKEIGQALGTAHILEGSVQHDGNKVRITAQLINVATDEHLWADTYDRTMDDIFTIQSDIANQIAKALQAKLSPEEKQSINKKYTENSEAYQLYLQGRYYWNQRLEEPVKKGITFFKKAIELDSTYALAYTGLGDAYLMLGVYSALKPDESFPVAKTYTEKALQLDPALGEAYATLIDINIHYYWDTQAAEKYFQKAIELNPNYANAYHWHSEVNDMLGEFDEAIEDSRKALALDPYNIIINNQMGKNLIYKGDMMLAVEQMQKTLLFDSTSAFAQYNNGLAYIGLKQFDKALHHLQISIALVPGNTRSIAALAFTEAALGNKNEAKHLYDDLLLQAKSRYIPSYDLAVIEIGLGDIPKAMSSLEQAYKNHEPWMPFIRMNPLFSSVYGNSQFQTIVGKISGQKNK
jgi:adenylate cyclase